MGRGGEGRGAYPAGPSLPPSLSLPWPTAPVKGESSLAASLAACLASCRSLLVAWWRSQRWRGGGQRTRDGIARPLGSLEPGLSFRVSLLTCLPFLTESDGVWVVGCGGGGGVGGVGWGGGRD